MTSIPIHAFFLPRRTIGALRIRVPLRAHEVMDRFALLGMAETSGHFVMKVEGEGTLFDESWTRPEVEIVGTAVDVAGGSEIVLSITWPRLTLVWLRASWVFLGGFAVWAVIASILNPGFWSGADPLQLIGVLVLVGGLIWAGGFTYARSINKALARKLAMIERLSQTSIADPST